jgi:hypothetical protein
MYRKFLSDEDIVRDFMSRGGGIYTADALVRFLEKHGISHRNPIKIAAAVNKLVAELPSAEEQEAFQTNLHERYGNPPAVPDVSAMSMAEYARNRAQLGVNAREQGLFA